MTRPTAPSISAGAEPIVAERAARTRRHPMAHVRAPRLSRRVPVRIGGAADDVRIEDRDEALDVAARSAAMNASTTWRWLASSTSGGGRPGRGGARGSRAGARRRASARRSARSRRTASRTDRAARTRSAPRARACRARREREADRVGEHRAPGRLARRRSRSARPSSGSSRRDVRVRSMSRHTRATTVVSQPRGFSTSLVSARSRRSHASCTASSASASEPSMRYATPRRWLRCGSKSIVKGEDSGSM